MRVQTLRFAGSVVDVEIAGSISLAAMLHGDDGDYDRLTGAAGDDWFFAGLKDKLTDYKTSEMAFSI